MNRFFRMFFIVSVFVLSFAPTAFAWVRVPGVLRSHFGSLYLDVDSRGFADRRDPETPWKINHKGKDYPLFITVTWMKYNPDRGEHWEEIDMSDHIFRSDQWHQITKSGITNGRAYQERTYKITKPGEHTLKIALFSIDGHILKVLNYKIQVS